MSSRLAETVARSWWRRRLGRQAHRYAAHGWPVRPGAYLSGDRFRCGPACPTVACHPAPHEGPVLSEDPGQVVRWWTRRPYTILLPTGLAFDVLEVPASLGIGAARSLRDGPVAATPSGSWMFLVRPGAVLRPELAALGSVLLHAAGSWIQAPPSRCPSGPVRWVLSPAAAGWRLADPVAVQRTMLAQLPRTIPGLPHLAEPVRAAA